mmetsp:Transcript_35268/g.89243  ORF Transcript_35268/g.89243 Transcript_35268/m.89243 type:complete len:270 (-) Transcript_35268:976-1785(-)
MLLSLLSPAGLVLPGDTGGRPSGPITSPPSTLPELDSGTEMGAGGVTLCVDEPSTCCCPCNEANTELVGSAWPSALNDTLSTMAPPPGVGARSRPTCACTNAAACVAASPVSVDSKFSSASVMVGSAGSSSTSGSVAACALSAATSKFQELTPFLYSSWLRTKFLSFSCALVAALPCRMSCTRSPSGGSPTIRFSARYLSSLACLKNLCSSSWVAVGRSRGSFCRQRVTTSRIAFEKCFLPLSSSVGGGFCSVMSSTFMGGNLAKGACP